LERSSFNTDALWGGGMEAAEVELMLSAPDLFELGWTVYLVQFLIANL
jgi:hypothetical protein